MAAPTIYIVVDTKTVPDGDGWAVTVNWTQHRDRIKAEARYHSALASAANNEQYQRASATLMTNYGEILACDHYDHEPQPQPQPETEA